MTEHRLPQSPLGTEHLLQLPLKVGFYAGPSKSAQQYREEYWHLKQENYVAWNIRIFDTAKHMAAVTVSWTPHILITHWQGDYDNDRHLPREIAARLRQSRGPTIGDGPFLAGQVSMGDDRFMNDDPRGTDRLDELLGTFDMIYEAPANFPLLLRNIAIGICIFSNKERNTGTDLAFDQAFTAYLAGHQH